MVPSNDFDMWHDYMNLGKLLKQLVGLSKTESGFPRTQSIPGMPQDQPRRRENSFSNNSESVDLSPDSSISDTSRSSSFAAECCGFCKQNGEMSEIYRSHKLKAKDGRIICPILRSYTCPICDATGDRAHTRRYCPQRKGVTEPKFWGTL